MSELEVRYCRRCRSPFQPRREEQVLCHACMHHPDPLNRPPAPQEVKMAKTKKCAAPGCDKTFEVTAATGARKYCDEHYVGAHARGRRKAAKKKVRTGPRKPRPAPKPRPHGPAADAVCQTTGTTALMRLAFEQGNWDRIILEKGDTRITVSQESIGA